MAEEKDQSQILLRLTRLYGKEAAPEIAENILKLCRRYRRGGLRGELSHKDIFLITYGDGVLSPGKPPLATLHRFLTQYMGTALSFVHLLPFYPYTSDDGFSVVDYRAVNRDLGDWEDIARLSEGYKLVFDAVLNHVSKSSHYMREQCAGNPDYQDFLLTLSPEVDTSAVTRPRNLPLLHPFETSAGKKWFWTTFSEDQIDLNFKNPKVLLEILDVLLFYAEKGAKMIRLDAVPFMWKELGTNCSHLPQNHEIVKLVRNVYNLAFPEMILLSETNVPHKENIAYFGNGRDEAQIIYNFSLPPLILFSIHTGDARKLTEWAQGIVPISHETTFLNITATHDGIGMRPTEGILTEAERQQLVDLTLAAGGKIGEKKNPDGSTSPYELNITYYDALNNPNQPQGENLEIRRFLLSQAIPLSFLGLPGIYLPSLVGRRNDTALREKTGVPRSINRHKFDWKELQQTLSDPASREAKILAAYKRLLEIRQSQPAFHPQAEQKILSMGNGIFALKRTGTSGESILAVYNVTGGSQALDLPSDFADGRDLLGGSISKEGRLMLVPYGFAWINKFL